MFLYAYHYILPPKKGEKTRIDERIELSLRRKGRSKETAATYIIDLIKNVCIKNRYRYDTNNPVDDAAAINYFVTEYKDDIIAEVRRS